MTELHGNTVDLSYENEKRSSLFLKTVLYVITMPSCVLFMGISWFHLYSLCRFGRLYKNIPILLFCLLWWIGAVVYGLKLWNAYKRNRCKVLFDDLIIEDGEMLLKRNSERGMNQHVIASYEQTVNYGQASGENAKQKGVVTERFSEKEIKWFIIRKNTVRFFLKDKRVLTLDLSLLDEKAKAFLMIKLSAVSFFGKKYWRILACIVLSTVTVLGTAAVVRSAMPWQGKLGTYLVFGKNKKTVELVHDNVYEGGIEGVLEDIRTKIDMPETLCISGSFNMHFASDGKILSLNTMLHGFDEYGNFTDSYLISYEAAHSSKITVFLHGATGAVFKEEKDFAPLREAVSLIPWEEAIKQWEDEDCYGILYYGKREWRSREGIRILNEDGTDSLPPDRDSYFYGYSISLFCPENEQLTPVRYLYPNYISTPINKENAVYPADYFPVGEDSDLAQSDSNNEGLSSMDKVRGEEDFSSAGSGYRKSDSDLRKDGSMNYFDGSSVHETGNIWSRNVYQDPANQSYPTAKYGSTQIISDIYMDANGEQIYKYSYESFRMADSVPGADMVNAILKQKREETLAEWKKRGDYLSKNKTVSEEYPINNTPSDEVGFVAISYLSERYCSLVFTDLNYTGGARGFFSLISYTIDLKNGEEVSLTGYAGLTKEEWIERIDAAFEKEQGFYTFFEGKEYEETAGENWYESYEEGGWGSGFYFSDEGVVVYYGLGQITIQQKGVIEVVIPWFETETGSKDTTLVDIDKIYEYMIPEQSFDVLLNDWGSVTFVSCMPMSSSGVYTHPLADVSFYLLSNEQVIYRFPYVNASEGNIREGGSVDDISFVMFTDVNGDKRDDVLIGILFEMGAGPQGAIPRMEVRIYEDHGNKFVYNKELSDECYGLSYDTTAEEVRKMLLGK